MNKRQKTDFGAYLVEQIKIANISQEEFYNSVGIKKPYFYDLLTGTPPPSDLQDKMLTVLEEKLGENMERRNQLYDLAAAGRKEIPADIAKLISEHPKDLETIRCALNKIFNRPL